MEDYDVTEFRPARGKYRPQALSSRVMFLERYHDLLNEGGRVVAVIDDGLLGGDTNAPVRDFIRSRFIVLAVVSLPGDAFQRSQARVKTSIIVLQKAEVCDPADYMDRQGSVFMYACEYVGIDDPARERTLPIDRINRQNAAKEIEECVALYRKFRSGADIDARYLVAPECIADRMDVKSCSQTAGKLVPEWEESGIRACPLSDLLEPVIPREEDTIRTDDNPALVTYLRIRYDGFAERGDEVVAGDAQASVLYSVHEGDLVISNINAINGAVCVVPAECEGCVVTNEFTVCRPKPGVDLGLLWVMMRSPEARADLLLLATGIGRTRVRWENAANLQLPECPDDVRDAVRSALDDAEELEQKARRRRSEAQTLVEKRFNLDNPLARKIIAAFKPPR